MILLVRVCDPVSVTTILSSIETMAGEEPSYVKSVIPVPSTSSFVTLLASLDVPTKSPRKDPVNDGATTLPLTRPIEPVNWWESSAESPNLVDPES